MRALLMMALAMALALAAEHRGVVLLGPVPVPGASVLASQDGKKMAAITDAQGSYSFADLSEGVWSVEVRMLGFETLQRDVSAGPEVARWEMKMLSPDAIAAQARPQSVLPAQPTAPPVVAKTPAPESAEPSETNEFGADLKDRAADGLLINGSVNNGAASPFGTSPAFGNFRKGPRSLYNGNLGLLVDNSALDARPFSLTGQDTPRPAYNRMQAMGSFGGPLKIPHLLRNGPNFFVGFQLTRNRDVTTQPGLMPTAAERMGDLSHALPVLDPASGLAFPGNVIPQNRISPQARALLTLFPLPNFAGGGRYNFQTPVVSAVHQDSLQTRLNKAVGRRNQLSGSFGYQSTRSDSQTLFGFPDTGSGFGITAGANWRHTLRPGLFGNLGVQFSRLSSRNTPYFADRQNVSGDAGITGNNQDPLNWGPPALQFAGGISNLSENQQSLIRNQTSGLSYSVLWSRRAHNISFGGEFRRQQFNYLSQQDPRGTFTFTRSGPVASDLGAFLLGIPDTVSIAYGNADKYLRSSNWAGFASDDWRVNPGFSLNTGIRWEYGSPVTERYGRLVNLEVAPGFTAATPVVAPLIRPDKGGVQPRIGLAWYPVPGSSLVVRAGYGVYYNTSIYQSIAAQMMQQAPLSRNFSVQNPAGLLTMANAFHAAAPVTSNTFGVDPDLQVGYGQNWQVSVQRDLPQSLVATAGYVGIKGTRGLQRFLPNTYPYGAVNPCPECPSGFTYLTSNGNSIRHAAQFQLRRRMRSGVGAMVSYTFSKSLDNDAPGGRGQAAFLIAQNWLDLSAERGRSNFDQRHLVTVQAQYTSGMGRSGGTLMSGWKGALLKQWTLTSQLTAGTGSPLTPVYQVPVRGTGVTGTVRPDYTGASVYDAPSGLFLNPVAFAVPRPDRWGNAARNSITGPAQFSLNASLGRTFALNDRFSLDFRADATNALNNVTYPSWNTNISSAQFGLPGAANPMRTLQTSVRVRF